VAVKEAVSNTACRRRLTQICYIHTCKAVGQLTICPVWLPPHTATSTVPCLYY